MRTNRRVLYTSRFGTRELLGDFRRRSQAVQNAASDDNLVLELLGSMLERLDDVILVVVADIGGI